MFKLWKFDSVLEGEGGIGVFSFIHLCVCEQVYRFYNFKQQEHQQANIYFKPSKFLGHQYFQWQTVTQFHNSHIHLLYINTFVCVWTSLQIYNFKQQL